MKQSELTPEQVLPTWEAIEHVKRDFMQLFGIWFCVNHDDMGDTRLNLIQLAEEHNYAIPIFPETEAILKGSA